MAERRTKLDTRPDADHALLNACKRAQTFLDLLAGSDENQRLVALVVMGRPVRDELRRAIAKAESQ